jgi:hypothetical protein
MLYFVLKIRNITGDRLTATMGGVSVKKQHLDKKKQERPQQEKQD